MSNLNQGSLKINKPVARFINYVILIMVVSIILMPILIIVNVSFKTRQELGLNPLLALPDNLLNFSNFANAFKHGQILLGFQNTLIQVVVGVSLSIVLGTMTAYALNRFDFKLKKVLLLAYIIPITIPFVLLSVSTFLVISKIGAFNTPMAGFIIYGAVDVFSIYLFLQYLSKIPYSLDESASIDGASYFRIYFSIILPLMKPAIATAAIIKSLNIYNDFLTPMLYMPSPKLRTVTISLSSFQSDGSSDWTVLCAGMVIVLIPTLLMYIFLQKYIINGVAGGAVKE